MTYPNLSILENGRVCFNIKGNSYRLIVRINFSYQMMWIRFIGTHAEYDKIDANKIQKDETKTYKNRKRKLSLGMIRKLTSELNIPSEVLIQAY